jgi:hypothetical protein
VHAKLATLHVASNAAVMFVPAGGRWFAEFMKIDVVQPAVAEFMKIDVVQPAVAVVITSAPSTTIATAVAP